jgi:hypothetical protein
MNAIRFSALAGLAIAACHPALPAHAQAAPIPYLGAGAFGFSGDVTTHFEGPADEDGFRKGFSFRSYSAPASSFGSGFGLGAFGGTAGLATDGAQYAYNFKGIGDTPVAMFGSVNSLRTTPDVFTALVTPGFERSSTLATSVNAGIEFKPASNISLSLSAGFVQPSATTDTDLRSQLISAQQPAFRGWR